MVGYIILGAVLLLLAVLFLRALLFRPKVQPSTAGEPVQFDKDAATDALAQLVRCKTVSYVDPTLEDEEEFRKLIQLLPTLYPIDYTGNIDLDAVKITVKLKKQ